MGYSHRQSPLRAEAGDGGGGAARDRQFEPMEEL